METAPASKGYAGGFGTDLMLKDLGLAQENAMAVEGRHARWGHGAQSVCSTQPGRPRRAGFLQHHQDGKRAESEYAEDPGLGCC